MSRGELPLHDLVDLAQLFHQVFLVLQTAGRIHQQYVRPAAVGDIRRVINDSTGIRSLVMCDKSNACLVRPHLQLVDSCRPEGVRRSYDHIMAFVFQLPC